MIRSSLSTINKIFDLRFLHSTSLTYRKDVNVVKKTEQLFRGFATTTTTPEPMIKLEAGGQAPDLKYNIPEPNSFFGRNTILLDIDQKEVQFKPEYYKPSPKPKTDINEIEKGLATGLSSNPLISQIAKATQIAKDANGNLIITAGKKIYTPQTLIGIIQQNFKPVIVPSMTGIPKLKVVKEPTEAKPQLLISETYRLTSFRGAYGAGQVLKTFSLLPGEKTTISVSSYKKETKDFQTASSILDSYNDEIASDFESSIQDESSQKEEDTEKSHIYGEASASASWGWGSAKVKAGASKDTSSSREDFSRNVSNATTKHANKASSQRNVQINTNLDVKQEEGEESSTVRVIENINRARTLNFVFRQMNQEYFSVLHLVDIKVGFFNGFSDKSLSVPLSRLDTLLDQVCFDSTSILNARHAILNQLQNYKNYKDDVKQVIQKVKILNVSQATQVPSNALITEIGEDEYIRFDKTLSDSYTDPTSSTILPQVQGMIVNITRSVLRTEGVIVDALLGQGNALDKYSEDLQNVTIQSKQQEVNSAKMEQSKVAVGIELVQANNSQKGDIYQKIFPGKPVAPMLNVEVTTKENKAT